MTPTEESPTHLLAPHTRHHQMNKVHDHQQAVHEMEMVPARAKLVDINEYLTCHLCQGYLIDATTITECLHSFCRSCILKFLQENSHCPVCDLVINTAKPNLKPDKSMQDVVYKLVPELFLREMERRRAFYRERRANAARLTPEQRGEDTERTIFNAKEMFSLSLEYASEDNSLIHSPITGGHLAAAVAPRSREEHARSARSNNGSARLDENGSLLKRYLYCPGMCRIDVLKKFVSTKYNVNCSEYYIDILYKRVPLPGHYTLIDIAYIYSWKRNAPMKFFFRISDLSHSKDNCEYYIPLPELTIALSNSNDSKSSDLKATKKTVNKPRGKDTELTHNNNNNKIVIDKAIKDEPTTEITILLASPSQIKEDPPQLKPPDSDVTETKIEEVVEPQEVLAKVEEPLIKESHVNTSDFKPQPVKLIISVPKHLTDSSAQQHSKTSTESTAVNVDEEKQNFLKSFELAARGSMPSPPKNIANEMKQYKLATEIKQIKPLPAIVPSLASSTTPLQKLTMKRKQSSHLKMGRQQKRTKASKVTEYPIKIAPKAAPSSPNVESVKEIIQSLKVSDSAAGKSSTTSTTNSALQSLFGNCNINIPSSLSITLKETTEDSVTTPIKPVINHIEILKLPDSPLPPTERSGRLAVNSEEPSAKDVSMAKMSVNSKTTTSQRTSSSFQKMFEEAIKKPEFAQKIHAYPVKQLKEDGADAGPLSPTTKRNIVENAVKRNLMEIATQLAQPKKSKPEPSPVTPPSPPPPAVNCNGKVAIPRLPPSSWKSAPATPSNPQTVANLHSASLGINYTVSINQQNNNINAKVESPKSVSVSSTTKNVVAVTPKASFVQNGNVAVPPKVSSPRISTSTSLVVNKDNAPQIAASMLSNGLMAPLNLKSNSDDVPETSPVSHDSAVPNVSPNLPSQSTDTIKVNGDKPISSKKKQKITNNNNNNNSTLPQPSIINPNELLEKYNIQNLAQLTAGWNLGTQLMSMTPTANQLAFQQAMLLKHFEIQNRQNWLNTTNPLMAEYKKYLQQTLNAAAAAQAQQQAAQTTTTAAPQQQKKQQQLLKEN